MSIKCPADMVEGTVHPTNTGSKLHIVKYTREKDVIVRFEGYPQHLRTNVTSIRKGVTYNPYAPSIAGVGYLGIGEYTSKSLPKVYARWKEMFKRCYEPTHKEYARYGAKGVYVDASFHCYQDYVEWYLQECARVGQDPHTTNWHVDKDILCEFLPVSYYSTLTCQLVSPDTNYNAKERKTFYLLSPEGECIAVNNVKEFCNRYGLNEQGFFAMWRGEWKHYKGWAKTTKPKRAKQPFFAS